MSAIRVIFSTLFGEINWTAPSWLRSVSKTRKDKPLVFWSVPLVLLLVVAVWFYYQSLPQPLTLQATIHEPELTPDSEDAKPNNLVLEFFYNSEEIETNDAGIRVSEPSASPARIDLLDKVLEGGVSLSPKKAGEWRWVDDNQLVFSPELDWQPGIEYTIHLDKQIFSPDVTLADGEYTFATHEFNANIEEIQFYQDPTDASVRRVVSTLGFTHPVEKEELVKLLSYSMRPSDETIQSEPENYDFTVELSKTRRQAFVHSQAVKLPEHTNYMTLAIKAGLKSASGGTALAREVSDRVAIPDVDSYLQLDDSSALIARSEEDVPEQVVYLHFTDEIAENELSSKLKLFLLPEVFENKTRYWSSVAQVSNNVLAASDLVELKAIPNERQYSQTYSFVVDVPVGRSMYLQIDKGLTSVNKFVKRGSIDALLQSPEYPKEISISGDGSVLTYSGSHKLSVLSRGVPALRYSIGRLVDGQINHLVSQTYGDIRNPNFNNYNFQAQNLAEYETEIVALSNSHPKKANYSSLDLSAYLPKEENRFGLFFVEVQGWNPDKQRIVYGAQDKRLVLVTDLGMIVKSNADTSQEIFVQSIQSGEPVANAEVTLLGKNGLPLHSVRTDRDGHAGFPGFTDYHNQREKQPVVYVVKAANDLSFIPYDRSNRRVQLSRFDIGGERTWNQQNKGLNAFVFSDRGIYRPGDDVNLGFIVKNRDLTNVENIPLEWSVVGPRGNEVASHRVNVPKYGLFDGQLATDLAWDTGNYQAALYLVRNNRRYSQIGSTNFSVEEFQPDTMKIKSRLLDVGLAGWTDKTHLQAEIKLENLFGLPAQNRKTDARITVHPTRFTFNEFKGFTFSDPFQDEEAAQLSVEETLDTVKTNAEGIALYDIDLSRFSGGTYRLDLSVEGFDQAGGRSVEARNSILVSPLKKLVGMKANGDLNFIHLNSERKLEFIAIDQALSQVNYSDLKIRRLEIQTVSTLVKQPNGTYQYQSVERENELESRDFSIGEQGENLLLDSTVPGDFVIELRDAQGLSLARARYAVVGHGNMAGKLDKNAELQVKLNKEDYLPGEEIELSIRAPYVGSGLITIETDKVESYQWFSAATQSSMQTIRIPEHLEGGAYIHVALVRDVTSKEIFSSPFSYAVEHFSIDKSGRRLDIELTTPEIAKPGETMPITYRASKPSRIAVFAVDEGILQVSNYRLPKPLQHYLKKKALGVSTYQILDLILPEFEVLKMLSAAGGGNMAELTMASSRMKALAGQNLNPFQRKLDVPAVFWSGIVDAGPENKTLEFDVPDTFSGALRIMAVAVSDMAMGSGETHSLVRGPFVISPNLLTSTVPGDEFQVTVGVSNIIEGSGKNAAITLEMDASEHFDVAGDSVAHLTVDEGGESKATFTLTTLDKLGAAHLNFTASYKQESQRRSASLSVRPAMPYASTFVAGHSDKTSIEYQVPRKLYPALAENKISASLSPLVVVDGLTSYLEHFPHGCTEQVVSKVFPLIGLMSHSAYGPHLDNVQSHFNQLISKLSERQTNDGGFNFWPGSSEVAPYPTIYATHFLLDARGAGFNVPPSMLNRAINWMENYVVQESASLYDARIRANAIYLLTRMGRVTTNHLVDLQEYLEASFKDEWQKDLAAVYMAASYSLLKNSTDAEKLISAYRVNFDKRTAYTDFDSLLTQDAQYIYLLAKHFPQKAENLDGDVILALTEKIFKGEYNTIAAAYTVLALGAYSELALENKPLESISFKATVENIGEKVLSANFSPFATASYSVDTESLEISGEKGLFYLNVQNGYDKLPADSAVRENLEIYRSFLDENGNEVKEFTQGKELTVKLKVRTLNGEKMRNIAVVDLLPGGFEVIRESVAREYSYWIADYVDIREDRIVYYGSFDSTIRELSYKVKLTASGKFMVPPSHAESMYNRSVRATSLAGEFVVTPSN